MICHTVRLLPAEAATWQSPRVISLPSRYEDLAEAFRGRLRPNGSLLALVQRALSSMEMSGGIRFLPLFGVSGVGKSSAAREVSTHLEGCKTIVLSRGAIESDVALLAELEAAKGKRNGPRIVVAIIDQYEEKVEGKADIPTQFVERLSLLDRGQLRGERVLFVWLTTDKGFQRSLAEATTRNRRMLLSPDFELAGPDRADWADIIEETFEFHNNGASLADLEILPQDIEAMADKAETIGQTIELVGERLAAGSAAMHDLSQYQVVMLWPVTDGMRTERIQGFTYPREGYKLNWGAFWRGLSDDDKGRLPLAAYNRARLYFDMRLIPIPVADLAPLGRDLGNAEPTIGESYFLRFERSHFVSVVRGAWSSASYAPLLERESARSERGKTWYAENNTNPTGIGRRIAWCLRHLGIDARHEVDVKSNHSTVRADVLVNRGGSELQRQVIVELKAFSPENTYPASIRDAIKTTLRRHAQFAGFLAKS